MILIISSRKSKRTECSSASFMRLSLQCQTRSKHDGKKLFRPRWTQMHPSWAQLQKRPMKYRQIKFVSSLKRIKYPPPLGRWEGSVGQSASGEGWWPEGDGWPCRVEGENQVPVVDLWPPLMRFDTHVYTHAHTPNKQTNKYLQVVLKY